MKMKMDFKKGMDLQQIKEVCDNNHQMLWDYIVYLNERGKAALDTFSVISWYIPFCNNTDELAQFLIEDIEGDDRTGRVRSSETKVIKNLRAFIKNILNK